MRSLRAIEPGTGAFLEFRSQFRLVDRVAGVPQGEPDMRAGKDPAVAQFDVDMVRRRKQRLLRIDLVRFE